MKTRTTTFVGGQGGEEPATGPTGQLPSIKSAEASGPDLKAPTEPEPARTPTGAAAVQADKLPVGPPSGAGGADVRAESPSAEREENALSGDVTGGGTVEVSFQLPAHDLSHETLPGEALEEPGQDLQLWSKKVPWLFYIKPDLIHF